LELCTLGDLLVRGSEHHPGRDALVLPGVRRTYRKLEERATGVARSLTATGVTRGSRTAAAAWPASRCRGTCGS